MGGQNCRIWAQLYNLVTRGFTLQPEAQLLVPRLKDLCIQEPTSQPPQVFMVWF